MRALDEIATAIQVARRQRPVPIHSSVVIEEQFPTPIAPPLWHALQHWLRCPLPPLEFAGGHWFIPAGLTTIWDLVDVVLAAHPEWEPPRHGTVAEWRNAQIFAAVRESLARWANVRLRRVTRETTLWGLFRC